MELTSPVSLICCITCLRACSEWARGSGLDLLRQASCLSVCSPLPVSGHRRSGGKRGCQEGEWRAKPVLTQHLKPPHKYRLPFPISKAAPSTSVYTLARRSVSCTGGVSLKMTAGHLAETRRGGGALMCWQVRPRRAAR